VADFRDDGASKPIQKSRFGRALKFGGVAARVASSYVKNKLLDSKVEGDQDFEAFAESAMSNAKHIVKVMGEMKGAAMKVGQLISTDPDLLSSEFSDALSSLQRNAPPMDYDSIVSQVEKAFDRRFSDIFSYFDPEPIGSASIGQVHRAKLHNGQSVAVKIQYPGVADCIDSDLRNIRMLLSIGKSIIAPQRADELIAEARQTILDESDYEKECKNIQRFRKRYKDSPELRIPRPYPKWTRKTVLTMEYMDGIPLEDALTKMNASDRDKIARALVEFFVFSFHLHFEVHGDPHPGNLLVDAENRIILLDFGCVKRFQPETADMVLKILVACQHNDTRRAILHMKAMGFGQPNMEWPSDEVMNEYLNLLLKPLLMDGDFDLSQFEVSPMIRKYMMKYPQIIKLVPPAELLIYFRVLGGLKGLVSRSKARVNFFALAQTCVDSREISI
jgi:predicted unusual protein kinase regulating ubiquinone biosynthesis (AarF/ABC1/UbiB family)